MIRILPLILCLFIFSSCITPKVYNDLLEKHEIAKKNLSKNEKLILDLRENIASNERSISKLTNSVEQLRLDSTNLNNDLLASQNKYNEFDSETTEQQYIVI